MNQNMFMIEFLTSLVGIVVFPVDWCEEVWTWPLWRHCQAIEPHIKLWPFDVTKLAFSPRDIHLWPVPFSMLGAQVMNLLLIVFHLKEVKILSYFQVWLKSWKMTFSRMFKEFTPHFIYFAFLSHFSVSEHQSNFNIGHKIQLLN